MRPPGGVPPRTPTLYRPHHTGCQSAITLLALVMTHRSGEASMGAAFAACRQELTVTVRWALAVLPVLTAVGVCCAGCQQILRPSHFPQGRCSPRQ